MRILGENLPACAMQLVGALHGLPRAEQERVLRQITAQIEKPRITRALKDQWQVESWGIKGKLLETWTEAVAYAKQWHANMYSDNEWETREKYWKEGGRVSL
jgi:hypothetical protein